MSIDSDVTPRFGRQDLGITPFWQEATPAEREAQLTWQAELATRGDIQFGDQAFVSRLALVYPERLLLGARTYVSAYAAFWGDIVLGADCTVNPFCEVRGRVTIGNGVRIGAHTSIYGYNHGTDVERPIYEQPLSFVGIEIGDDVWVGSHVVILDGVKIGSHSIIGGGAVVSKDIPEWSVAVGSPARVVRDRREPVAAKRATASLATALSELAERARREVPTILERAWNDEAQSFVDHLDAAPTIRAWCDVVELSTTLGVPLPVAADRIIGELRGRQDLATGLLPDWAETDASPSGNGHAGVNYHVLAAGYALDLLGSSFPAPISAVSQLSIADLRSALAAQPWGTDGWKAGSWVDSLATAMVWNQSRFALDTHADTLLGWLVGRADPATGMWSPRDSAERWLQPVNGFYRLTRGTFAQFGLPLPYPEQTIDTVLTHSVDGTFFGTDRGTACNVLDVIHPLWLAGRQTNHRRAEGEQWARAQLARISSAWTDGEGFSFALQPGAGWARVPSLLGTEMWLAITWLLADYLGVSDALEYRPRGVHRPEAVPGLTLAG